MLDNFFHLLDKQFGGALRDGCYVVGASDMNADGMFIEVGTTLRYLLLQRVDGLKQFE